jgi:diacylglycerol kinase family enzyme
MGASSGPSRSIASHYTYRWRLKPDARIDDGWLDMCLFETDSPLQAAQQVVAALRGRHEGQPGVRHLRARRLSIDCDPPVAVQLDGDYAGQTPTEITIAPKSLTVVVPERAR